LLCGNCEKYVYILVWRYYRRRCPTYC